MTLLPAPLPDPWRPLTPSRADDVRAAIRAELAHPHRLDGQRFSPYAECGRCTIVVVELPDGRHAMVRPSWTHARARPPSPRTDWLGGPHAAAAAMRAHATEHTGRGW